MSYIGANDLVFNNNKVDGIFGGGFSVNSIMMKNGISPIMTLNSNNMQNGGSTGNVSDIFSGLAIPAYAYHNNYGQNGGSKYNNSKGNESDSEDDVIDDDLHDKLLGLVKEHESRLTQNERKKKRTRKHIGKNKKAVTKKKIRKEESTNSTQ
jgi:hypothetical protein